MIDTTHAEDVEALANRLRERDLPARLLREVDLVVFPRQVDGERYVSRAIEPLSEAAYDGLDPEATRSPTGDPKRGGAGVVEAGGESVRFNTVAWRDGDGTFRFPCAPGGDADGGVARAGAAGAGDAPGDDRAGPRFRVFDRIANRTDRDREAVAAEFASKRRYVEYLVRDGVDDPDELFEFLADLRTDEAATVERADAGNVLAFAGATDDSDADSLAFVGHHDVV
ncbi:hypothetical protein DJ68_01475, partial [Halorubrum sp. C3]